MSSPALIHPALDALHAETPLRVWSIIVTIFGDIVMREGTEIAPAPMPTAGLQALLALLGIDANAMRAALSRLTAGGTLVRSREGRNTFYALSSAAGHEFAEAATRIYARPPRPRADFLMLAAIDRAADKAAARQAMAMAGWHFLGPTMALKPGFGPEALEEPVPDGTLTGAAMDAPALAAAARDAFATDALGDGYHRFCGLFADTAAAGAPDAAAALRVLAVHRFRRLILRDPLLPMDLLPPDWPGDRARRAFDATRAALRSPSEAWLVANGLRG